MYINCIYIMKWLVLNFYKYGCKLKEFPLQHVWSKMDLKFLENAWMHPNEHACKWMHGIKIYKLDAVSGCKVQVFGFCMPWCIRFRICSMALSASFLWGSAIADPHRRITVSLIGCTGKVLACNWSVRYSKDVRWRN